MKIIRDGNLSFAYLSHEIRKIPLVCREGVQRKWDKGWQDKLREKETILPQMMKIHPEENSGLTTKEVKRGCRLMANYAEIVLILMLIPMMICLLLLCQRESD